MPIFKYVDREQMQIEIKKLILDEKSTQRIIARRLGMSPQSVTKLLNKKNFGFDDALRILNALDYDLYVEFRKQDAQSTVTNEANV